MSRSLVIGYGNPLRGDDAFGLRIVEACQQELPSFDAVWVQQLMPELAERIAAVDQVIFVDARIGDQPGAIRCDEIQPVSVESASFTHSLGPQSLLTYSRELFHAVASAHLITVVGASFAPSDALSPAVDAALPKVIELIRQLTGSSSS